MPGPATDDLGSSSIAQLVGAHHGRWSLQRAVDAFVDAGRQASRPGWIWLAGLFYPSLSFGFLNYGYEVRTEVDRDLGTVAVRDALSSFGAGFAMTLLFAPIVMRLIVGLARVATPSVWGTLAADRRPPPLRAAWDAGQGHTLAALGLWLQLVVMVFAALALLILPPFFFLRGTGLAEGSWPFLLLIGPFVAVWLLYGLLLSVMYQLSLHSLAQNRRGVSSALVHAWRIVRHDPWATVRATTVDLLLSLAIAIVVTGLFVSCIGSPLAVLLVGFAGTTRAAYWARAYRALGGLSPDDQVPGLAVANGA
jgi:hypothetical protein